MTAATVAHADNADAVVGQFAVKYAQVTSNCDGTRLKLTGGAMTIASTTAGGIEVTLAVANLPMMVGSARKAGRIKAASKLATVAGMDGKFSIAGTVKSDGSLDSMLFIAEYYDRGKAQCTQTWSVSGSRAVSQNGSGPTSEGVSTPRSRPLLPIAQ